MRSITTKSIGVVAGAAISVGAGYALFRADSIARSMDVGVGNVIAITAALMVIGSIAITLSFNRKNQLEDAPAGGFWREHSFPASMCLIAAASLGFLAIWGAFIGGALSAIFSLILGIVAIVSALAPVKMYRDWSAREAVLAADEDIIVEESTAAFNSSQPADSEHVILDFEDGSGADSEDAEVAGAPAQTSAHQTR